MSDAQTKRQQLLELITAMGYAPNYAKRAISHVDPTLPNAAELVFHWMEENPFREEPPVDRVAAALEPLLNMGFGRDVSLRALEASNYNVDRAIISILSDQTRALKQAIHDEVVDQGRRSSRVVDDYSAGEEVAREMADLAHADARAAARRHSAATESDEMQALASHISALQELVGAYQEKYKALRRRAAQAGPAPVDNKRSSREFRGENDLSNRRGSFSNNSQSRNGSGPLYDRDRPRDPSREPPRDRSRDPSRERSRDPSREPDHSHERLDRRERSRSPPIQPRSSLSGSGNNFRDVAGFGRVGSSPIATSPRPRPESPRTSLSTNKNDYYSQGRFPLSPMPVGMMRGSSAEEKFDDEDEDVDEDDEDEEELSPRDVPFSPNGDSDEEFSHNSQGDRRGGRGGTSAARSSSKHRSRHSVEMPSSSQHPIHIRPQRAFSEQVRDASNMTLSSGMSDGQYADTDTDRSRPGDVVEDDGSEPDEPSGPPPPPPGRPVRASPSAPSPPSSSAAASFPFVRQNSAPVSNAAATAGGSPASSPNSAGSASPRRPAPISAGPVAVRASSAVVSPSSGSSVHSPIKSPVPKSDGKDDSGTDGENPSLRRAVTAQVGAHRKMLHVITDDNSKESKKAAAKPARGWINTGNYRSLFVELTECLDISPKLGKTYFCVVRVDSTAFKTKLLQSADIDTWNERFEFPLMDTTQNITVTLFDNDEDGFVGRVFISLERLQQPLDHNWHKLTTVRPSLYDDLRMRAKNVAEVRLKIEFSINAAVANPKHVAIVDEKTTSALADAIRSKVSKKKLRFQEDGFDLDLSYITDRIIAMGFPSSSFEGVYRNRMKDVQRFFQKRHYNRYKVYNLCAERSYDASKFEGMVVRYPFNDHQPCPFLKIIPFCKDVHEWLSEHPQNVAAIHCKAGKGRTGLLISCYLIYAKQCFDAESAMKFFAEKRTRDGKGVTIPSQIRYIHYFNRFINGDPILEEPVLNRRASDASIDQIRSPSPPNLWLSSIRIFGIPVAVRSANVNVWFKMTKPGDETFKFSSRKSIKPSRYPDPNTDAIVFLVPDDKRVLLQEDVTVQFFYGSTVFKKSLFHFWFNTRFVPCEPQNPRNCRLLLKKEEIDGARKDKKHAKFPAGMRVELLFRPTADPGASGNSEISFTDRS